METFRDRIESSLVSLKQCVEIPDVLLSVIRYPNSTSNPSTSMFDAADTDTSHALNLYHIFHRIFEACGDEESQLTYDTFAQHVVRVSKPDVVFQFLCDRLDCSGGTNYLEVVIQHLELFLFQFRRLPEMLSEWCASFANLPFYERLVRSLTALPTRVGNRVGVQRRLKLLDQKLFVSTILSSFVFDSGAKNRWSLYGLLVSQLVLAGYSADVASFILSEVKSSSQCSDEMPHALWSHITACVNERSLEMFLLPILRFSSHPHLVAPLIPREQLFSATSAYIRLFRRLLFVRYFPQGQIVRNIFGALAESTNSFMKPEDRETVFNLVNDHLGFPALRLWADATAIQATSVEQHIYTSQTLASWLVDFYVPVSNVSSCKVSTSLMLPDVLSGVSNHLASPRQEIQVIGMAVGEWIVRLIDLTGDSTSQNVLQFSYNETDVVKQLRPFFSELRPFTSQEAPPSQATLERDRDEQVIPVSDPSVDQSNELDSDDDPDPDAIHTPCLPSLPQRPEQPSAITAPNRRPHFLRECLDGMLLTKPEDNQTSVACFEAAADLIYAHPQAARELATELAHVFVHLEPPACPEENRLASRRHAALVALGVVAPRECARYLTNEFCQPNCSFGQRQNIIAAITDIACTMSTTMIATDIVPPDPPTLSNSVVANPKARRFCRKPVSPPSTVNGFMAVAGEFFFPLLRSIPQLFCCSQSGSLFAHQDASLLSNLIASLATVYACARFAPIQLRMASELMEILPPLYKHSEPAVRRAVLIAMGNIITTTPPSILSSNPQLFIGEPQVEEAKVSLLTGFQLSPSVVSWLKRCIASDADFECQLLASVGLSALVERAQEMCNL